MSDLDEPAFSTWCSEDLVAEIHKLHDMLTERNERIQKRCADLDRTNIDLATARRERDEAITAAFHFHPDETVRMLRTNLTTLQATVEKMRKALEQYKEGDEHAEKEEFVAAAAHYEEGDRLRAAALSTPSTPIGDTLRGVRAALEAFAALQTGFHADPKKELEAHQKGATALAALKEIGV